MTNKNSKYPYPSSYSGGVKPLAIRGLYEDERCRISEEYTEEERMWRKQWLKDQILSPNEPRDVPELDRELRNPLRRFSSMPWEFLETKLTPIFGQKFGSSVRFSLPRVLVIAAVTYFGYYHLKYNQHDWTRLGGWSVEFSRPVAYPGDPGYPIKRERLNPQDYEDCGFKARKVFLD